MTETPHPSEPAATTTVRNEKTSTSQSETDYDEVKAVGCLDDGLEIVEIDPGAEKRVLRKLDCHIIPMAVVLYLVWYGALTDDG